MGVRRVDKELVQNLFSIIDESLGNGNGRRAPTIDAAFYKCFIRQGVIPFEFFHEMVHDMKLSAEDKAKFVEDTCSVCQLTGPDLIADQNSVGRYEPVR